MPRIRNESHAAMQAVLDEGWFILGPAVTRFEENFATYLPGETLHRRG